MAVILPKHICVTRPQWDNILNCVTDMFECRYSISHWYHFTTHNHNVTYAGQYIYIYIYIYMYIYYGNELFQQHIKLMVEIALVNTTLVFYGSEYYIWVIAYMACYTRAIKSVPSSIYFYYTATILTGPWCNTLKDTIQFNWKFELNWYNWLHNFW